MIARIYTGDDGQTHFEDLNIPAGEIENIAVAAGSDIVFRRFPADYFSDWHCAPRRQYIIILSGQMEIGIGIHGEPGRERMPLKAAREIIALLAEAVISDLPYQSGDQVVALVNGMGGTPLIEIYLVYQELVNICREKGITIVRRLVGNYITSLEMAGCSITLLKADNELLELWDAPVHTPALRWGA